MQSIYKHILALIGTFILSLLFAGSVYAANLNIQIEQPKSPTNQDTFDIVFVALDINNAPVTVQCFKKGPSDGSFSQFGGDISLSAGGSSGKCSVTSSIMNADGTYQFFARATNGSETQDSATVSVDLNKSGPGTPINYSKEKISNCTYKITFKTADDGGETVKVELYRSENTSFTADSGTRVGSMAIGSNTDGNFANDVPNCDKTYYYAIRAFDSAGNGSGVIGDSVVTVEAPTTVATAGAIPVGTSQVAAGAVLGEEIGEEVKEEGEALGEATPSGEQEETITPTPAQEGAGGIFTKKNVGIGVALVLILIGGYYFYRRFRS